VTPEKPVEIKPPPPKLPPAPPLVLKSRKPPPLEVKKEVKKLKVILKVHKPTVKLPKIAEKN